MDTVSIVQFIGSLALVCALIIGFGMLIKKTGLAKHFQRTKSISGNLAVEDVLYIDARHRCLVIRWHDAQHLVLMSAGQPPQIIAERPSLHTETSS